MPNKDYIDLIVEELQCQLSYRQQLTNTLSILGPAKDIYQKLKAYREEFNETFDKRDFDKALSNKSVSIENYIDIITKLKRIGLDTESARDKILNKASYKDFQSEDIYQKLKAYREEFNETFDKRDFEKALSNKSVSIKNYIDIITKLKRIGLDTESARDKILNNTSYENFQLKLNEIDLANYVNDFDEGSLETLLNTTLPQSETEDSENPLLKQLRNYYERQGKYLDYEAFMKALDSKQPSKFLSVLSFIDSKGITTQRDDRHELLDSLSKSTQLQHYTGEQLQAKLDTIASVDENLPENNSDNILDYTALQKAIDSERPDEFCRALSLMNKSKITHKLLDNLSKASNSNNILNKLIRLKENNLLEQYQNHISNDEQDKALPSKQLNDFLAKYDLLQVDEFRSELPEDSFDKRLAKGKPVYMDQAKLNRFLKSEKYLAYEARYQENNNDLVSPARVLNFIRNASSITSLDKPISGFFYNFYKSGLLKKDYFEKLEQMNHTILFLNWNITVKTENGLGYQFRPEILVLFDQEPKKELTIDFNKELITDSQQLNQELVNFILHTNDAQQLEGNLKALQQCWEPLTKTVNQPNTDVTQIIPDVLDFLKNIQLANPAKDKPLVASYLKVMLEELDRFSAPEVLLEHIKTIINEVTEVLNENHIEQQSETLKKMLHTATEKVIEARGPEFDMKQCQSMLDGIRYLASYGLLDSNTIHLVNKRSLNKSDLAFLNNASMSVEKAKELLSKLGNNLDQYKLAHIGLNNLHKRDYFANVLDEDMINRFINDPDLISIADCCLTTPGRAITKEDFKQFVDKVSEANKLDEFKAITKSESFVTDLADYVNKQQANEPLASPLRVLDYLKNKSRLTKNLQERSADSDKLRFVKRRFPTLFGQQAQPLSLLTEDSETMYLNIEIWGPNISNKYDMGAPLKLELPKSSDINSLIERVRKLVIQENSQVNLGNLKALNMLSVSPGALRHEPLSDWRLTKNPQTCLNILEKLNKDAPAINQSQVVGARKLFGIACSHHQRNSRDLESIIFALNAMGKTLEENEISDHQSNYIKQLDSFWNGDIIKRCHQINDLNNKGLLTTDTINLVTKGCLLKAGNSNDKFWEESTLKSFARVIDRWAFLKVFKQLPDDHQTTKNFNWLAALYSQNLKSILGEFKSKSNNPSSVSHFWSEYSSTTSKQDSISGKIWVFEEARDNLEINGGFKSSFHTKIETLFKDLIQAMAKNRGVFRVTTYGWTDTLNQFYDEISKDDALQPLQEQLETLKAGKTEPGPGDKIDQCEFDKLDKRPSPSSKQPEESSALQGGPSMNRTGAR